MDFLALVLAVVALLSAILHGLSGMGFPLLATTALSLTIPLAKAVALLALPTLLINFWIVLATPKTNTSPTITLIKPYLPLIITSVIGGVLGVRLLILLPKDWLLLGLGMTILASSLHGLFTLSKHPAKPTTTRQHPTLLPMTIAGFLAGLIGTATNAMSPILLFYLFSQSDDKLTISKVSNVCYLLSKLLQITLLWQVFFTFERHDWVLLAVLCLVAIIGVAIGTKFQARIPTQTFKKLIYGILLLLSCKLLYNGIF